MDGTEAAEPRVPAAEGSSASATPALQSSSTGTRVEHGQQHAFTNPTLNIIHSLSRKSSASCLSLPSREGTPPPLPPRPQLGLLPSRPSTSHASIPTRPQLVAKPTTQLSFANTQAFGSEPRDDSSASSASKPRNFLGVNAASRAASDGDDSASIRSYAPTTEAGGDAESILGEVMGSLEKTEQEKLLLQTLGHRFEDTEAQSMFPPDPEFDAAFDHEFDEIDDMASDGSNEGQTRTMYLLVAVADVVHRGCHAALACKAQAFPHPFECRQAYIQSAWR